MSISQFDEESQPDSPITSFLKNEVGLDEDIVDTALIRPASGSFGWGSSRAPHPLQNLYETIEISAITMAEELVSRDERYKGYEGEQTALMIITTNREAGADEMSINIRTVGSRSGTELHRLTGRLEDGELKIC